MSIQAEHYTRASALFFELLRRRMIPNHDRVLLPYYEQDEIREALKLLADEAGILIVQGSEHVHFVARPEGSVFATSFTQLKRRYSDVESKKYFRLLNIIVLTFLAEIDVEISQRLRWETNGVSYYLLEQQVNEALHHWKDQDESSGGAFSVSWGLAVEEMTELWDAMALDDESDRERLTANRRTHIGLIHMALRLLKDENLVYIVEEERRVIPRSELYERLENVYHQQDRYREMKSLIGQASADQSKRAEEVQHAKD